MQYLYDDGENLVFMDQSTFDQIEISKTRLDWEKQFLKGDEIVEVVSYGSEILGVNMPAKVALKVTECDPATRGDTINKAMKEVTLETGFKTKVPMFIEEGEIVLVRTDTGEYDGRA